MPTIFQTFDKGGKPHRNWRFKYIDYRGDRKTATGLPTKEATKKLANKIQTEQDEIRNGLRPAPKECDKPHPFEQVAAEYLSWGAAQGGRGGRPWGDIHLRMRRTHLKFWKERLALEVLADAYGSLPKVEAALRELKLSGRTGKTLQNYAEALAALCDWAIKRGYLDSDPLKDLQKFDSTPKMIRRALTDDEVNRLLAVAPPERRILYEIALATGLRANELRSLRVRHIDVAASGLTLEAAWTKARKAAVQPLHPLLIAKLVEYSAGKDATAALLKVPHGTAGLLYKDLAAAGIPRFTSEGKVDFHALRVAYITMVYEVGASGKEAQTMSRHATPALTEIRYARTRASRLNEIAVAVGDRFVAPAECPTGVQFVEQPNGKDAGSAISATTSNGTAASNCAGSIPVLASEDGLANVGRKASIDGLELPQVGHRSQLGQRQSGASRSADGQIGAEAGLAGCPIEVQRILAMPGVLPLPGFAGISKAA